MMPAPTTPDLSGVSSADIAKALGQPQAPAAPQASAPDLSSVPTSAIAKALGGGNGSAPSSITRAAQGLVGQDGGRLGCATTACRTFSAAGIPFPMTANAAHMESQMTAHGFARVNPSEADVLFGRGTGPSGRHVMLSGGGGRTIEDPGGSRGNIIQYGRVPGSDPTLTGYKYVGAGSNAGTNRTVGNAGRPAPDLSGVSSDDIDYALHHGGQANPGSDYADPRRTGSVTSVGVNANPNQPTVYFSPAYTGKVSADPNDYFTPTSHGSDPIGHAFLALDAAGMQYQQKATPQNKAAYHQAVQQAVDTLTQTGALSRQPVYQAWVKAAVANGLVNSNGLKKMPQAVIGPQAVTGPQATAAPRTPAGDPTSPLPFVERIIGADGHKGTFHQQIDDLGTAGKQLWQSLVNPSALPSTDPAQYADSAAMYSNTEGAGDLLARVNRQNVAKVPSAAVDMTVPGGSRGLIAHGAEAAVQGRLPQFGKTVLPGITRETLHNPVGQLVNVVSLVGAAKIPLDMGAETLLGMGGKLTAAAESAEAAGNASAAAGLRSAAQKAKAAAQDMKVASVVYGRAATGGRAGDYAANTAARIARKHFPGSGLSESLTDGAMNRSLGKAVVDTYPGYKAARSQAAGRITPQSGDVNLGDVNAKGTNALGLRSAAPVRPATPVRPAAPALGGLGMLGVPSRSLPAGSSLPLLPSTSPRLLPPLPKSSAAPNSGLAAPNSGLAAPGTSAALPALLLHPSAPGENGAARAVDGTFAPASPATVSAPTTPGSPAQSLVPSFPVSELRLDPDRFQYKIGYGQGGGSGSLTDAKTFNPDFAGVVHAWRDPADGKAYVVNGHNRVGLAKRTGTPGIDVRFLNAPDAAAARTKGALINIAEGQGTALDAAKLFRETGYTQSDLQHQGINLKGQKASQGLALANLSDPLFHQAMRGTLPTERAAIIGANVPDHGDQATLMKQVKGRSVTNDELREMAQAIAQGPRHSAETSSLFGTEEVSRSLAVERAQAASYIKSQLAKDGGAFSSASKNAERLTGGGNVIDAPSSARLATQSKQSAEVFDAVKNAPGAVSDILNASAKRLARAKETGESPDAIKQDALRQFRQYAGQHFPGLQPITHSAGTANDAGTSGSLSFGGSGGPGGSREGSAALGGPGSRGANPAPAIGERRRGGAGDGRDTSQSLTRSLPTAALTPDGRQVALKGAAGTLYVNAHAYADIAGRLGASETSQGVSVRPPHVQQVTQALTAAMQDARRNQGAFVRTPAGRQYLAELQNVAAHLTTGIQGRAGLPIVKVEPGQTLAQTKAVARHERTHAASYNYPLSLAGRAALDSGLSAPAHPLHVAYAKAQAALAARGYAPEKTWDEIPAVLSAGPTQYGKMGLSDTEAQKLAYAYTKQLSAEHGPSAVRAVFSHGSATARTVAKQAPATAPAVRSNASPVPANTSPDEMRLLTSDEIQDIRKAGLLSSPKQIVKAVAGHVSALGADEIARVPAALTDFLISAATGRDRTIGDVRLQDLMRAAKKGSTEGVKLGWQVMRHGSHGLAAMGQGNPMLPANHPPFRTGYRLLDTYVNGVFQMHEGAYASLRLFALHRSLLEMADIGAINAVRRGLIPKAQQESFRQHLYNAPSDAMMAAAIAAAEEATLTNSNQFSRMYFGAADKGGPLGRVILNHLAPFPKIEGNVAGRSLEMATGAAYAPLQFAHAAMKKGGFTAGDQQRFSKTFGRGLVGLGLIALGVMIAAKKRGQPSDEKHHQPGSVRLGGRLFPTNTVAPSSNLLQLGIDLHGGHESQAEGQPAHGAGDALANLIMEQPWAKAAPGDLTDMLTSGHDAKKQIGQQAASYVPAILADAAAQFDPVKRKQAEPLDYVKNRIPGLRSSLPPALDSLGQPRPEVPSRLFNPFGGTPVGPADTPAMRLMQQDLSARVPAGGLDALTPRQQASLALRRSILDMAAQGKDIRPAVQSALRAQQITPGQARHLVMESRMSRVEQKVDLLPLSAALDVYQQGSPAERAQMQSVMLRKLAGAARSRSLMPQDMQRARALGIVPPPH